MDRAVSALVIAPAGWRPACMDVDEYDAWAEMNRRTAIARSVAVDRPCRDCTLGFAAEMRSVGRCNGTPGGEEEEPMEPETIDVRLHRRVPVTLSPPPCASCAHEPVCALRAALEGLTEIPVAAPPLPDGLRITLTAAVECAHFLRDRSSPTPAKVTGATNSQRAWKENPFARPRREVSDLTRQKMRDSAIAAATRRAAANQAPR